ncbi:hypothetical protein [Nocardia sp. NPDC051570]|uniref:hypothetical protein n=1 Tax=Nocardia sp. NPDC051570 TaxID=3364324 RepID=UPI003798D1D6
MVLVGDAAHCASPYSGMGVSGALVGAYVLAGEINRRPHDLPGALANYDTTLRPFVDEIQATVNPRLLRLGMPTHQFGIDAFHALTASACFLRIPVWRIAFHGRRAPGSRAGRPRRSVSRNSSNRGALPLKCR